MKAMADADPELLAFLSHVDEASDNGQTSCNAWIGIKLYVLYLHVFDQLPNTSSRWIDADHRASLSHQC
jgi:hypothetical protein